MHRPSAHAAVPFFGVGHSTPHFPQFLASSRTDVSQPFARAPSQFPLPGLQLMLHLPSLQVPRAPGKRHERPQPPQLDASEVTLTQRPLHSVSEGSVHRLHSPAMQVVPFAHDCPQVPQLFWSVWVSTQLSPQRTLP